MGGGGAMRAATKVASFGINAGLRNAGAYSSSSSSIPVQEQSVRNASRSVSLGKLTSSASLGSNGVVVDDAVAVAAKTSSLDDWEFAEEDDILFDSMNPKPRLVFGGVLSYQEAKDATNDLKEAVEREYMCSSNTSSLSMSGHSETKSRITSESAVAPSVTKPIFQAFSLLKECPEAQSVVASLASDKNVWDAVMQNEKVMEFIKVQQNCSPSEKDTDVKQHFQESDGMDGVYAEDTGNEFMEFIGKVKITVKDMVSRLSGFFQSIFGGSTEDSIFVDENGNVSVKAGIGASFMALAVLTIMVAVLKRG